MRPTFLPIAVFLIAAPVLLGGCSSTRELLGLTKRSPDEFQVVAHAPLSMPPDYNLRPPTPGAPRPQEGTSRDQAEQAILRNATTSGTSQIPEIGIGEATEAQSTGESALLQSASTAGIDPNIRTTVNAETDEEADSSTTWLDSIIFWREPEPFGDIVDPAAEQKRLQENQALGTPSAGPVPVIQRRRKGLFEGLF